MPLNEDTLKEILARRDYILSGHARTKALGQFFTWSAARAIDAVALLTEAYENEDWQATKLEVMEAYVPDSMVGWSPAAEAQMLRDLTDLNFHGLCNLIRPLVSPAVFKLEDDDEPPTEPQS